MCPALYLALTHTWHFFAAGCMFFPALPSVPFCEPYAFYSECTHFVGSLV